MEKKEIYIVEDIEQVRAISDPIRIKILECCVRGKCTTKQIAEKIHEKPTRLYHHVDALEQVGLIVMVETRPNRGTVEKYYEAVAEDFIIAPDILKKISDNPDTQKEIGQKLISGIVETTVSEIKAVMNRKLIEGAPKGYELNAQRIIIRINPEQISIIREKIEEVLQSFKTMDHDNGEIEYVYSSFLYPIIEEKNDGSEPK